MVRATWPPSLTADDADDAFMRALEDDTEEAPWMSMGDLQFWSASRFADSLDHYAKAQGLGWYVAGMMPILYRWRSEPRKRQLAPDTFVAFVADHPRESFDAETEPGGFPPFVLEVVSSSSQERDRVEKRRAYRLLKVREYALFTPQAVGPSTLTGFRRSASGRFVSWRPDRAGRLWSAVLGLYLVVVGREVRAQTADGRLLPTLAEAEAARAQAEAAYQAEAEARQQAEARRERAEVTARQAEAGQQAAEVLARQAEAARRAEALARQQAEAEIGRLRQELARQRRRNQ